MSNLSTSPNETGFNAEVGTDSGSATLFDSYGNELTVPKSSVEVMLTQGYRLAPVNLGESVSEFMKIAEQVMKSMDRFVSGVESDKSIDVSDESEAYNLSVSMATLNRLYNQVVSDAYRIYPQLENGEHVKMTDADGNETQVDPNQIDEYVKKGFKKN